MILTVRELVDHLGMNPKTEVVGASIMVRVLERLGAIKKVGSRPFVDENGKPTIGRPSALYEFADVVSFTMPTESLPFVVKEKKEKKVKKVVVETAAVDLDLDDELEVAEEVASVEEEVAAVEEEVAAVEEEEEVAAVEEEVAVVSAVDFSGDDLLGRFLRESA